MLKFRTYTYAFTADIKMMYRTILINPKQRNLQRIVWCESEHESPKIYELSTVTYGTVSAPYLAQRTLTQLSMDEEANFPIAASVLRNKLYMDDVLCGAATLTIPRLELCAAVLLVKLVKRVVAALQLETTELYLWSDSMIVLTWLRREPMDLKTFVIQELYPNQLWRHVPSDQNPADLVSRGVDPDKLLQQNLWFNGPTFL
ncbi:uncharacterized protein TNCV_4060461 [Trichonephila clavipes]|nr:uncharacterized protein TNCV_4060461 [Trichonephila clavipes]